MLDKQLLKQMKQDTPILEDIMGLKPVVWFNQNKREKPHLELTIHDVYEAEKLWERFIPFFIEVFPEIKDGVIESPLVDIEHFKAFENQKQSRNIHGSLFLKSDHELPVAGSIKARGGFFEVLKHAEQLALEHQLIQEGDDYAKFAEPQMKQFFNDFTIGVGSTGNLGLSIGIMSAKLGFNVNVYMSADAKAWKKELLRKNGAHVHEFSGDFSEAISEGRKQTLDQPNGYFVDDEDSKDLFLGYSTVALRLKQQLDEKHIKVDKEHPLFVYLPCGVGGSPGGVTFGLKEIFGPHVHCFFVEPTTSPAVLTGLVTGKMEEISVQDIGISNQTEADGLAVGRPSKFATKISDQLMSGLYTIEDDHLFKLLVTLKDQENISVEPSATAGLIGPWVISETNYISDLHVDEENITHIAWSTGGSLVPEKERKAFYELGQKLLKSQ